MRPGGDTITLSYTMFRAKDEAPRAAFVD